MQTKTVYVIALKMGTRINYVSSFTLRYDKKYETNLIADISKAKQFDTEEIANSYRSRIAPCMASSLFYITTYQATLPTHTNPISKPLNRFV